MNDRFGGGTVTELGEGWLQVKVPLPYSLKWVNAYLLPEGGAEEEAGWTLVDPGLRSDETETFWNGVLAERGIDWRHIRTIVVTHHHPDHYGLAGWFMEKTGAPVLMSKVARDNAVRLWGDGETFSAELTAVFAEHGLAEVLAGDMLAHMDGFAAKVSPQPDDVRILSVGDTVRLGGAEWTVYGGEGHAPGHLLLHDAASGRLLCGDQVLPDISPNIGWMPGGDPDPLGSFLDSLRRLESLEVSLVYPGHRDPFPDYRERIAELLDHHERRLLKMAELLANGGSGGRGDSESDVRSGGVGVSLGSDSGGRGGGDDVSSESGDGERDSGGSVNSAGNGSEVDRAGSLDKSAFEVCELLFGARLRGNTHNLRFALAETIAHLEHMAKRGTAERFETATATGDRRIFYRVSD
ncbi:MBL fold metallo-hydrolase [Cohnella suwonensis]|uniref:MBL fold metallo-hydrolase n=1 Tax=Cohnella suwonensis TaxID=696072 RepID=A0ABW0LRH2_9BACL